MDGPVEATISVTLGMRVESEYIVSSSMTDERALGVDILLEEHVE